MPKYHVVVDNQPEVSVSIDDHRQALNAAKAVAGALARMYPEQQVRVLDAGTMKTRIHYVGERTTTVKVRRKKI